MRRRGIKGEHRDHAPISVVVALTVAGDGYDVMISSVHLPGVGLWTGHVTYPLRPVDENELRWAAEHDGFSYRDVCTMIREQDRAIRYGDTKPVKPSAPVGPKPRAFKQR